MILLEHFPQGLRKRVQAYADQQTQFLQTQYDELKAAAERDRETAIRETVKLVQEIDYSMAMLTCIEKFGFSCDPRPRNGKPPRLQQLMQGIEEQMSYYGNTFGLEMLDGVRGRLLSYNVKLEEPKID